MAEETRDLAGGAGEAPRPACDTSLEVAKFKAAIDEFAQTFAEKTSSSQNFITIFEYEDMIKNLLGKTYRISMEFANKLIDSFDESNIIQKKKRNIRGWEQG
jgi:hypothetical protein